MMCFQRHVAVVEFLGELLEHQARHQTVEVASRGENNIRLGQFQSWRKV